MTDPAQERVTGRSEGGTGRFADSPVVPDRTSDETAEGWGEPEADDNLDRLLAERPPHW